MSDVWEKEADSVIEDLQEAITFAGGCFFRKQRLKEMTFGDMLANFQRNGVTFKIEYDRNHPNAGKFNVD